MVTRQGVIEALKSCYDPELGMDIWSLGLVYEIKIHDRGVYIKMTLTTPFCPYAAEIIEEAKNRVKKASGASDVKIELVFEPSWKPSDELKTMLGI